MNDEGLEYSQFDILTQTDNEQINIPVNMAFCQDITFPLTFTAILLFRLMSTCAVNIFQYASCCQASCNPYVSLMADEGITMCRIT